MANATARWSTILSGSWLASGLRHDANAADNALVRPVRCAVASSIAAPACDTTGLAALKAAALQRLAGGQTELAA